MSSDTGGGGGPGPAGLFGVGLLTGVSVGLLFGGLVAGFVSHGWVKRTGADVRRGWALAPVVVAIRDLAPGTSVTLDDLAQRRIPNVLVTASDIPPDGAVRIANLRLLVPVKAGDPLEWAYFASSCDLPVGQSPVAPADQTVEAIRARLMRGGAR